jgi:LAO/AO transport system kinase
LEIADVLTVNKCDRQGADHIVKELSVMLELASAQKPWTIPVLKTVAEKGMGVADVYTALERHREFLSESGSISDKNITFAKTALINICRDLASAAAIQQLHSEKGMALLQDIAERKIDPFSAAKKIFSR